jgi:hypothetical protein
MPTALPLKPVPKPKAADQRHTDEEERDLIRRLMKQHPSLTEAEDKAVLLVFAPLPDQLNAVGGLVLCRIDCRSCSARSPT